jgi:hypothetical protein
VLLAQGQETATVTPSQWKCSWVFVIETMPFFVFGSESSLHLHIYTWESSLAEIRYLPFTAEQAEIWLLVLRKPLNLQTSSKLSITRIRESADVMMTFEELPGTNYLKND